MIFGLLNVDKPARVTSRHVVNRVQRLVKPAKVGHAGTLDPLATGVLVICLGPATRLAEYVQRAPKSYTGRFLLGQRSTTEDLEGEIEALPDAPAPSLTDLQRAAERFVGRIEQRPPAFSALKVRGQRAYELARRGHDVELEPREVDVYSCRVTAFTYPEFELEIECGGGTYIRALGRDIAESLGSCAVMSRLTRTAVGPFHLSDSCDLDDLDSNTLAQYLLPARMAVASLPRVQLTAEQVRSIANGGLIRNELGATEEVAALDDDGQLIAVMKPRGDDLLRPAKNFLAADSPHV